MPTRKLTRADIYQLTHDYIGVDRGYLGDFSYATHREFYPRYCNLDIDPSTIEGTTKERFIAILEQATPQQQAQIVAGVLRKYPVISFPEEQRERRQQLHDYFSSLIGQLQKAESPADDDIFTSLKGLNAEVVEDIWHRALERRTVDPEAAITSARTLIESVCKHILDDLSISYEENWSLSQLYKAVAAELNLSPDQHTEQVFRQILGGAQSVVGGLSSVRNKFSDAHGKGRLSVRPKVRHATLAVNMAGTMATFLVETYQEQKQPL